ncbi:pyridoxine/pyridoxamine 5'-phosphate oxidase [Agromyces luteolus]|uniref:Pyridoxine/pyridoxamine 5'-phosphate oxidase n=1 Tax=Agromyces luteolus TaxID=88373 RepID=A0A7C9LYJ7_9MICO|nr:pyridoxamine 5'-phosphate oxidase [Agromyces luteolus]MUN06873.1 pyridoxamine 5'-phosphate oxidase [Agromyces luteolus]GLK29644.1 pyridoxine/pyridoxamine 5'-phosphate oxidase [Agromyces luteolus]
MSDAIDPDRTDPERIDRAVEHALTRRKDYGEERLDEAQLAEDPFVQFDRWLADADDRGVYEPNAMVLGTIDADGVPSSRTVLLRGVDDRGFVFYTDRSSRKGRALAANPTATLVFPWYLVHRQVIVTGTVGTIEEDESDAYWATRPYGSRIAATASRQSEPIGSRAELEERVRELEEEYAGVDDIRRPERWGGYRLRPWRVEFWQGRTSRLHDRLVFQRDGDAAAGSPWRVERLQP